MSIRLELVLAPLQLDVSLADVYAVIAFYLQHRSEVDTYLREIRGQESEVIRQIQIALHDGRSSSEAAGLEVDYGVIEGSAS